MNLFIIISFFPGQAGDIVLPLHSPTVPGSNPYDDRKKKCLGLIGTKWLHYPDFRLMNRFSLSSVTVLSDTVNLL